MKPALSWARVLPLYLSCITLLAAGNAEAAEYPSTIPSFILLSFYFRRQEQ